MAMTFTPHPDLKYPFSVGSHNEMICYMVPDTSYPAGGYVYNSATVNGLTLGLDLKTIFLVTQAGGDTSAAGYWLYQNFETQKLMILISAGFTPAGTNSAPAFTGSALAVHGHTLHFQTSAAANAVTAATNQLRTAAAAFDVATVANSSGEGGIVSITAGTPAGTVAAPVFTGTAVSAGPATEASGDLSALRFLVRIIGR